MSATPATPATPPIHPTTAARSRPRPASTRSPALPVALRRLARNTRILLAKSTIPQEQPPVLSDTAPYRDPGFRYDTTSLERVQQRIDTVAPDARGMRWIHGEPAVLFHAERDLDIAYDDLVARVPISSVGWMFRDVLGITTEVLARDGQGRPTLQLERIAALTQPNYSALMGKDELDVYKLEHLAHSADEQRNWMRTVHSPNGSAICDDGYLAYVRRADGRAGIAFLACQEFPMPRLMVRTRLERWPWLRTMLTEAAYRRFFDDTVANIVAAHEGREFRIGRPGVPR